MLKLINMALSFFFTLKWDQSVGLEKNNPLYFGTHFEGSSIDIAYT